MELFSPVLESVCRLETEQNAMEFFLVLFRESVCRLETEQNAMEFFSFGRHGVL